MQFTKRNLQLVRDAVELAIAHLHNEIATCPDVVEYAEQIKEHEAEQEEFKRLLRKIDYNIVKEGNASDA